MQLKKQFSKRSVKLVTLMLTGLLIATVSATTYYSLTMESRITVSTPVLKFDSAPDEPSGSTVNDAWCRLTAKSYPNASLTYEQALYINNTDSNPHSFRLSHVSITPTNGTSDVGNWTSIKFLVYDGGGYQFSLNYTVSGTDWILEPSSGSTGYYSVPASTSWWIRLETHSPATAQTGMVCDIRIALDVQE